MGTIQTLTILGMKTNTAIRVNILKAMPKKYI
jgi:hypothetical protein